MGENIMLHVRKWICLFSLRLFFHSYLHFIGLATMKHGIGFFPLFTELFDLFLVEDYPVYFAIGSFYKAINAGGKARDEFTHRKKFIPEQLPVKSHSLSRTIVPV